MKFKLRPYQVSIHTPIQGVTGTRSRVTRLILFQSTHPYRVWRPSRFLESSTIFVSIHTPIQGVTSTAKCNNRQIRSFNPHTHTGCDATADILNNLPKEVSIHTPIQGVTWHYWLALSPPWFQSTHPYRVWLSKQTFCHLIKLVSIHTPIQGVTYLCCCNWGMSEFQSTHPYRVWREEAGLNPNLMMFQSTHPYRVWRWLVAVLVLLVKFQSTHPYRVWQIHTTSV